MKQEEKYNNRMRVTKSKRLQLKTVSKKAEANGWSGSKTINELFPKWMLK